MVDTDELTNYAFTEQTPQEYDDADVFVGAFDD